MKINPYLAFDGNCAEAFRVYERVLGAHIEDMMTFADSPMADQTPESDKQLIMHASMTIDGQMIMASDAPGGRYERPQGVFISIGLSDVSRGQRIFEELSEGGSVIMPFGPTFWAAGFAMFTDRFGTPWMINCERPQ